jgi:hypothetical protein
MADTLVYLYAVGDAVLGETVSPGRTRIGGAAVRVIVDGPLGAVVHGGRRPRPVRCGRRLPGGDGIHVNIPLEEHKLCPLVMIGVRSAGRKELGALADGYRESTEGGRICCATPPAAGCAPRSSRSATGRWDVVVVDVRINTVAFVGDLDLYEPAIYAVLGEMRDVRVSDVGHLDLFGTGLSRGRFIA